MGPRNLRRGLVIALVVMLAVVTAHAGAAGASRGASDWVVKPATVKVPGQALVVSCMSPAMCVISGPGVGKSDDSAELVVLHDGKVVRYLPIYAPWLGAGGVSISCPSAAGCVASVPTMFGAVLVKITRTGLVTHRQVNAAVGTSFDSISCRSQTTCELAGWDASNNGTIVVAAWNGTRLTAVRSISIPTGSGVGHTSPQIACTGAWCEIAANLLLPNSPSSDDDEAYLVTTYHGKPIGSHWVPGYQFTGISCSAGQSCYTLLENYSPTSNPGSLLARVIRGVVGPPTQTGMRANDLACTGSRCTLVGVSLSNPAQAVGQISTFVRGEKTWSRFVPAALGLSEVSVGPRGFFVAIGTGLLGSVLTTG
jgi:hypothetical protein